jgi:uncharacterized membrane protein
VLNLHDLFIINRPPDSPETRRRRRRYLLQIGIGGVWIAGASLIAAAIGLDDVEGKIVAVAYLVASTVASWLVRHSS